MYRFVCQVLIMMAILQSLRWKANSEEHWRHEKENTNVQRIKRIIGKTLKILQMEREMNSVPKKIR